MTEHTVEFVGREETIEVAETDTILSGCLEAGIAQEYSCRVGMCLACSAKIHEGEVEQQVAVARGLTEAEAEEYALTCMARPASDLKLERGRYPPSIEDDAGVDRAGDLGEASADD
jgi:ferredoxin